MTGPSEPRPPAASGERAARDVPGGPVREALQAAGYTGAARVGGAWAVRAPDGAACALQVLRRAELGPAVDERVARLRTVEHAHVARVATVVEAGGELAVVLRGGTGTPLRDVLARRGALRAGEVVTIVTGVGHALGALHAAGLAQGGVTADRVVVDDDGRCHLQPSVAPPGTGASPAADVRALAGLARDAVADGTDAADGPATDPAHVPDAGDAAAVAALLGILDASARGDGTHGATTAEELANVVARTVAAEPVSVPDLAALAAVAMGRSAGAADGSAPSAADGRPVTGVVRRPVSQAPRRRVIPPRTADPLEDTLVRARALAAPEGPSEPEGRRARAAARLRRRRTRTAVLAGAVAGLVVVAVALAVLRPWTSGQPAEAAPSASAPAAASHPAPTDATLERDRPELAARELTQRRGAMLAGATAEDAVTVHGSPARAADDALAAQLARRGTIVTAPRVDVAAARLVTSDADAATVDVRYTIGAYTLRAKDGATTAVPAAAERTDRLELAWTDHGWRVRSVAGD
ncbi:hypothetical protein [Luteimicrobium xylanilyticum]|nr:hypothetical protein [Luteimicrobium xylanilyticum]